MSAGGCLVDGSFVRKTLNALCVGTLPILPGDMVFYHISGHRLLVVSASEQLAVSGSVGQHVTGILSMTRTYRFIDTTIDWIGLSVMWSIHRTP